MYSEYQNRPQERGGIVSFIIITLVLAGLFVGGVAYIKNREPLTANNSPETTQQTPVNEDNGVDSEGTAPETAGTNEDEANTTPVPAAQTPVTPEPDTSRTPTVPTDTQIAASGPTETFMTMIVLGVLAAAMTAYRQSRLRRTQQ